MLIFFTKLALFMVRLWLIINYISIVFGQIYFGELLNIPLNIFLTINVVLIFIPITYFGNKFVIFYLVMVTLFDIEFYMLYFKNDMILLAASVLFSQIIYLWTSLKIKILQRRKTK